MNPEKSFQRILFLFGVCFLLLIALAIRLFQIQIINFNKYAKLAARQHGLTLQENQLRGRICDRNGQLLRGPVQNWYLLVHNTDPKFLEKCRTDLSFLTVDFHKEAEINSAKESWIYSKPLNQFEIQRILDLKSPNLKVIANQTERDNPTQLAWHLLGMIVGREARSGLEYSLEPVLKAPFLSSSIKSLTDATHQQFPGLGLRQIQPQIPDSYLLTIDLPIQTDVEDIIDRHNFTGAIVVLEVKTGAILGMASRPMVKLTNLEASITDPGKPFINRAITAYPLGSIFKSVLLCAGLDSNLVFEDEYFRDQGYFELGDKRWKCTTSPHENGHGVINLTEAFAYSCNPVFIELSLRLNPRIILDYAEAFGFGRPANIGLIDEAWGNLSTGIGLSLGERANLALGQQLITATPLQVASLIQTIANDGLRLPPYLLRGKISEQGEINEFKPSEPPQRVIRFETARQVQRMMAAVLEYGTGREAQPWCKAAGKTGTVQNSEGVDLPNHAWFAGFAPLDKPRYVVVVFCEKGVSGGATAAPVFREVVDKITNKAD